MAPCPPPRLLTEYRRVLEDMDSVVRALDENIALAESLKKQKQQLDKRSADLDAQATRLEEEGKQHNAEVANFNAQCIDVQVTDQATGKKCNQWSTELNSRNSELTGRRQALTRQIEELNTQVRGFNEQETARASEAADLDKRYDEIESSINNIESLLSSKPETSDYALRCAQYKQAETRQKCMQQFWNEEH